MLAVKRVQKYDDFLKLPNFWAKKFIKTTIFCKKSKEKGVFLIESCNFAASNNDEYEKIYCNAVVADGLVAHGSDTNG
jgi:hypothetical protein